MISKSNTKMSNSNMMTSNLTTMRMSSSSMMTFKPAKYLVVPNVKNGSLKEFYRLWVENNMYKPNMRMSSSSMMTSNLTTMTTMATMGMSNSSMKTFRPAKNLVVKNVKNGKLKNV